MEFFSSLNKWSSIYSLTHTLEKVSRLRFRGLDKKERMKTFLWKQHWRSLALSLSSCWPWKRPKPPRCTNNSAQVVETVGKDLGLNLGFAVYYLWSESDSWPVQRELQSLMSDLWAFGVAQHTRCPPRCMAMADTPRVSTPCLTLPPT